MFGSFASTGDCSIPRLEDRAHEAAFRDLGRCLRLSCLWRRRSESRIAYTPSGTQHLLRGSHRGRQRTGSDSDDRKRQRANRLRRWCHHDGFGHWEHRLCRRCPSRCSPARMWRGWDCCQVLLRAVQLHRRSASMTCPVWDGPGPVSRDPVLGAQLPQGADPFQQSGDPRGVAAGDASVAETRN